MHINYSADDIKTVLTVKGADDLDVRNVNFGLPSIMNLEYYCTPEWMGEKLYKEYLAYIDKQDKYMSGFYSKDISGSTEESFTVAPTTEKFVAGETQEFIAQGATESFNADGNISSFNIDKTSVEFVIESAIEEFEISGNTETFTEPEMQTEIIMSQDEFVQAITVSDANINTFNLSATIIIEQIRVLLNEKELESTEYQYADNVLTINVALHENDEIKVYSYTNEFAPKKSFSSKSIVYVNGKETTNYKYDTGINVLTIYDNLPSRCTITIKTPMGIIQTSFTLSNLANKIASVKVDNVATNAYSINKSSKTLTITDTTILQYGSVITVTSIDNEVTLSNTKDKIIAIKINGNNTNKYNLQGSTLIITDDNLNVDDIVFVESVDTHFDLSAHKDKKIVSVSIEDNVLTSPDNYQLDTNTGILTILNYELHSGDKLLIKLVNNNFNVFQRKIKRYLLKLILQKHLYTA